MQDKIVASRLTRRTAALLTVAAVLLAVVVLHQDTIRIMVLRLAMGTRMTHIKPSQISGYTNVDDKILVQQDAANRDAYCFLVFGQSNVANSSNSVFQPQNALYNIHDGKIYAASPPLLGSDGIGSNPALEALDIFATRHPGKKVFILPIAISGSSVFHWVKTGELHAKLVEAIAETRRLGIPVTHVIYHQGEADCAIATPPSFYRTALRTLLEEIRALGVAAPVYLGNASLYKRFDCPDVNDPGCYANCPDLVAIQRELAGEFSNVYVGVNTDQLVSYDHRYDGYHFDAKGQSLFAEEMARLIDAKARP